MLRSFVFGVCAVIASCASNSADVSGSGPDSYVFFATADKAYPENSPAAEAERKRWLANYLAHEGYCEDGHRIAERTPERRAAGIIDIRYRIECIDQ